MQITKTSVLAAAFAARLGSVAAQTCPEVWTDVATELESSFVDDTGACTDSARAAIRMSFHDCFPGSCDGSLILANECEDRGENAQMVDICSTFRDMATTFDVGVADLIQFGAAMGLKACPGGPAISFKVGRTDSSTANEENTIPSPTDDAATQIAKFETRGFTADELVALVGAHSVAKNLNAASLDSTPAEFDSSFYTETADGTNDASLVSDEFLSNSTETADTWESFEVQDTWMAAFVPAMEKMSLVGNDEASLTDCSSIVSDAFA
ncbi:heme peroxidase [Xylariomycetidae sp. FL2044]|nr:heme peroxidase [Xylariomycetidae sp. FL2044]